MTNKKPLKARTKLSLSEERFHLLVDSVIDYAVFMLDAEGHIASWNKGAARIKGYTEEEILGKHFSVFYTQVDIDRNHPQHELEIATREGRFEEEGWRLRKDGSRFWASVVIAPVFESDGALVGFAKVTRDMTHRREMEEELRNLNRQLQSFAYSVSHDLRAPLRNMIFTAGILASDYGDKIDAEGMKMLQSLGESAGALARLITDLLTLSRLSRAEIKSERVDLAVVSRQVWGPMMAKDHATVTYQLEVPKSMVVKGDRTLLHVIMSNLLDNAVKFSPEGGTIIVGELRKEDRRVFFVRDRGIGFEMTYSEKIFLPFERLVPDREIKGSGIGLASVQQAVTRHGGKVWADSEPGLGTTVYFTLD